ncbi:hypothetical protein [Moorena producens]|nr:hypothetical protein [Moorena producens]
MRYGQQHNQGLEAENEAPPNAPYATLFPVPCSLFPVPFAK